MRLSDSPTTETGQPLVELTAVMARLRAECAWKAGQTHRSLARYLLEETHETLEAIDTGDAPHLREELGDLLLQVWFHAVIAAESGAFTIDDVAEACREAGLAVVGQLRPARREVVHPEQDRRRELVVRAGRARERQPAGAA